MMNTMQKLHDIEKDIPNKWRWEWLETKVSIPDPASKFPKLNWTHGPLSMVLKNHIIKVDIPGTASRILCSVDIEYTQGGLGTIKQHVQRLKHLKNLSALLGKQQIIPGASRPEAANVMYGAPPVYYEASTSLSNTPDVPPTPTVHILDRVANMEAIVIASFAEHSLSFALSEKLIERSLELSKGIPALKKLKKHRTTASYKLTHGLALVWNIELIDHMKVVPCSLNIDESTSTNTKHVFSIIVCYYNRTTKRIGVQHLGSVDVPSCTSETFTMKPRNCFFIILCRGKNELHCWQILPTPCKERFLA